MKKQKYYLAASALACSAVSCLTMPLANIFAVGPGSYPQDVTVGEVDEPTYSVDIEWGDMVFDWKYNTETNEYNFEAPKQCEAFIYSGKATEQKMYSDDTCSSLVSNPVGGNTYYSKEHGNDRVVVYDESENGQIKARVSFTPEAKYAWITGKIGEHIMCSNGDDCAFEEYENGVLQVRGSRALAPAYYGELKLEKNANSSADKYSSISKDDKIGTITITIEPDLN